MNVMQRSRELKLEFFSKLNVTSQAQDVSLP